MAEVAKFNLWIKGALRALEERCRLMLYYYGCDRTVTVYL